LSHTAGLSLHGYPGFGSKDTLPTIEASLSGATNGSGDVRLIMEPGTKWQYSGGGYTLAQLLVEEVTKKKFSDHMRDRILLPLGMSRSSYDITIKIISGSSRAYDALGEPTPNPRFTAQAAAGLHTTVEDLATFAVSALATKSGPPGRGILRPETIALMITPAPASDGTYGLGYGIDTVAQDLIGVGHSGANRGWQAYFCVIPTTGDGFVMVTNGSNGWSVYAQSRCDWVAWLTGTRPSCSKPLRLSLLNIVLENGTDAAVNRYLQLKRASSTEYGFHENELNSLGYILMQNGRLENALTIFKLNVSEYPESWNPYDSLAEAFMNAGNKELAIRNYQKSLELNPQNTNAVEMLKKLDSAGK
ncbi:MAG TPA: serine hydrolase, partial [Bacteroidota bacterium]